MRSLSGPALAWLWWRGRKDPGYRENLRQRLGHIEPTPSSIHGLLIHAASVGEVQAAQALITELRTHWPDHAITVTTQTPTGARALRSHWGDALQHLYFPVDTPGATARFLDRLQPSLVVLMEREIWPEWVHQCQARAIPVALVNARLSERSAAGYQRWQGLMKTVWPTLAWVAAADADSAERLQTLGVPPQRLSITGNLKFDPSAAADHTEPTNALPTLARTWLVAGSTHEGEETALLDAWPAFLACQPDALLVLVPRHPERFEDVARQITARGFNFARRSRGEIPSETTSIWLGDTMGELNAWYARASLCFIGGTLVPIGGHNPLEALAQGRPVLFGPHTHSAAAIYEALADAGAGQCIDSAETLLIVAHDWLSQPVALAHRGDKARNFVQTQQGASAQTVRALQTVWAPLQPVRLGQVAEHTERATTRWHDPDRLESGDDGVFEPPAVGSTALATGSGRGQAQRLMIDGQDVVLRHYRRGGLVARFNPDRYRLTAARDSRAMREYSLLRWMSACGLPVPVPVAARQKVDGRSYTADIIVAMIPGSHNLVQCLVSAPLKLHQWHAVGRAIRQLHDAHVFHSDLNAHNLLLDEGGQAWIVDFDKCERREGEAWKMLNLQRLQRSLRKESVRLPVFQWQESEWAILLDGYEKINAGN